MTKPSLLVLWISRVSPFGIGPALVRLNGLGCISPGNLFSLSLLSLLLAFAETFSVALMLPLLIFIEHNREIDALATNSQLWATVRDGFAFLGMPVTLTALAFCVLLMILLRQAVFYAESMHTMQLKHRAAAILAQRMFNTIFRSNAIHIQQLGTGQFQTVLDELPTEAATIIRFYGLLLAGIASIFAYSVVILVASPIAALFSFAVVMAMLTALRGFAKRARTLSNVFVDRRSALARYLAERYAGWRLIKLSSIGRSEQDLFLRHFQDMASIKFEKFRISVLMESAIVPTLSVVALVGMVLAVELSSLALSTITTFILVLIRVIPITRVLASQRQRIATFCVMLERFAGYLKDAESAAEGDSGAAQFSGVNKEIRFENVSVAYPGNDKLALTDVSVAIPAGSICAIVGPSGAGKTTFADLFPRLLLPSGGRILCDGRPLGEFSLASLRGKIAYVAQKPLLLTGSLRENISYGVAAASDDEILNAVRAANMDDFLATLTQGLDTIVGEGGAGLSGGQQQRLALARAFLQKADLLILDEPTSAQDYLSEQKLATSLASYQKRTGSTIIVIAHRLNTIRNANYIIVLDGGRLIESGPVASVALKDGWYAEMIESSAIPNHNSQHTYKE
jgi:ABC-type multidrug transport system fused ATPase/permease subunit